MCIVFKYLLSIKMFLCLFEKYTHNVLSIYSIGISIYKSGKKTFLFIFLIWKPVNKQVHLFFKALESSMLMITGVHRSHCCSISAAHWNITAFLPFESPVVFLWFFFSHGIQHVCQPYLMWLGYHLHTISRGDQNVNTPEKLLWSLFYLTNA